MNVDLDSVIDLIATSTAETPQLSLKSWLDQFYSGSEAKGLSSPQLIKIITFICNSPTLAMTTRLYITEKCLLPNEYITKELIDVVISQLGTATAISDSKFQVPKKIQVSLCKWLVHVFFLVSGIDESTESSLGGSIWLHLWQFDFLQHWITYIILWSTTSPKDVKRWKVILLGRVGSKPNYRDSQACATLLLKRFESIAGKSGLITRTITDLRCNERRLKSLQDFKYNKEFIARLRMILLKRPLPKFADDVLDELIASSLKQLKCYIPSSAQKLPFSQGEGLPLLNSQSLAKLASQWDAIIDPLNVEQFFAGMKRNPCHLYLLSLGSEHRFWNIANKWVSIKLGSIFKKGTERNHSERDYLVIQDIIRVCQIYDSLLLFTIKTFFNAACLVANPNGFLLLFTQLFSLPVSFTLDHQVFNKNATQVMVTSLLDRSINQSLFPSVADVTLQVTRNQLDIDNQDWIVSTFDLIRNVHEVLIPTFSSVAESRFTVIALVHTLKSLLTLPKLCSQEVDLERIILPPEIIRRQLISDDPLLLDACCHYLICTRDFLLDKSLTNTYVKFQNDYILDLTNYLWRNKIIESKKFLGVPSEFLRAVIDNLYLPGLTVKTRHIFSITGVPALSYTSAAKVRQLETAQDVSVRFLEPLTEESFKVFMKSVRPGQWVKNVSSFKELKIEILKAIDHLGPYNHVAAFLFTYLKSLSQYSTVV